MSLEESFNACPGYEAETLTLTLNMIKAFLYAIRALVVGFTAFGVDVGLGALMPAGMPFALEFTRPRWPRL